MAIRRASTIGNPQDPHGAEAPRLEPFLLGIHQANDITALWKAIIALLAKALPGHHVVAALPYEGAAPMAFKTTIPCADTDEFRLKLYGTDPPIFGIARRFPGMLLADLDEHLGEDELTGSRFYREVLVPSGIRHAAALMFWDEGALSSHVGVWRNAKLGRFQDGVKGLLRTLHPHLDAAIRRVALIARLELLAALMADALEHPADDGIALLDARGRLVFQNQAAVISCAVWNRGRVAAVEQVKHGRKVELPACVREAAMGLLERFLAAYGSMPTKGAEFEIEISHPGGEPVSARARVVAPQSKPVPLHVRIEFSRLPQNGHVRATGLPMYRLSRSEHRVALLVARGLRNHEVASETGISVNTVRAHLREVFSKLGVSHRGQLMDRLALTAHYLAGDFEI